MFKKTVYRQGILFFSFIVFALSVNGHTYKIDSLTKMVDGAAQQYSQVHGGDTLLVSSGKRDFLLIRNIAGEPGLPVMIINSDGEVIIDTEHYFGILMENCRYIHLTGTGSPGFFYGFSIQRVANGACLSISKMSTDVEIDHIHLENSPIGGLYSKTDPDCSFMNTREKFVQKQTLIHDNYIAHVGNEGMYVGSTKYFGQHVNCNGKDTLLMPSLLDGVRIYNNIIEYTGWDGIQVSSASSDCRIFDNIIRYDSQAGVFGQMSGIIIGGGSKCDCYNNFIYQGMGDGIESHGLGGYRIFNNIIVEAGYNYFPDNLQKMKYGIMVTDISVQTDSSFGIMYNDIIKPKSDGIRFLSVLSKNNQVYNNAIINPGNYDYYQNGGTNFRGKDSYIMVPDPASQLILHNNFLSRSFSEAGFAGTDFLLLPDSPLIDAGYLPDSSITSDIYHHIRPYGKGTDIGAVEFDTTAHEHPGIIPFLTLDQHPFPDPVKTKITIRFTLGTPTDVVFSIYNVRGLVIYQEEKPGLLAGSNAVIATVDEFPAGIYLFSLRSGKMVVTGKFIRTQ